MLERLKSFAWGYVIIGALLCAIGILFIAFQNAFNVLAITMGIILAVSGIVFGVRTLVIKKRGLVFALRIAISIIAIACGIVSAVLQDSAISVIANIFFLLLIVDGSFKLNLAVMSKRFSFWGWWVLLCTSVALIVGTFILTKCTFEKPELLSVFAGIVIAFDGIINILSAFWNTALLSRLDDIDSLKPEEYYGEPEEE